MRSGPAGQPYIWLDSQATGGSIRSSGHARAMGRRGGLLRLAVRREWANGATADRSGVGEGRARRARRQTLSLGRQSRRNDGKLSRRSGATGTRRARPAAAPTRRTATACSISPATCGSGCTTGTARPTTRPPRPIPRPVRAKAHYGCCAAAAGFRQTHECCPAAIATKYLPTHTRYGIGFRIACNP